MRKQFSFVPQRKDEKFTYDAFRSMLGIMGTGRGFRFWTEAPCCDQNVDYFSGSQLLESRHLSSKEGWKIQGAWIPWSDFDQRGDKIPTSLANFEHSWRSYYAWRGLPLESPAVLLLHWPMTVYRLLSLLKLVPSRVPSVRRKLIAHYIGVESELKFFFHVS